MASPARSEVPGALGGACGTRTPNLLIRSKITVVQCCLSSSGHAGCLATGRRPIQLRPGSSSSVVSISVSKIRPANCDDRRKRAPHRAGSARCYLRGDLSVVDGCSSISHAPGSVGGWSRRGQPDGQVDDWPRRASIVVCHSNLVSAPTARGQMPGCVSAFCVGIQPRVAQRARDRAVMPGTSLRGRGQGG